MRLGMKKRRRFKALTAVLLCVPLTIAGTHTLLKRAEPVFTSKASAYSNKTFTELVNRCIAEMAGTEEFSEFFDIISNDSQRITAIEANTAKINVIKSQLLLNVQDALAGAYPAYVNIPLGSLSGYYLFAYAGPSIPIRIMPSSIVNGSFDEEFVSVGINQVKHKIYLNISVDMNYTGYLLHESETITASVPIAETVIVGEVPDYYGSGYAFGLNEKE